MIKILILAFALLSLNSLHANWLNFRGNQSNGFSASKSLIDLNADQEGAWRAKLPGRGLSSPIIVGDKVFLSASSGVKQETLHIFCFSCRTGLIIWERKFRATGRTICHEKTSVAASTMTSDGSKVVAQFSSNDVFCLTLSGDLIWLRGLTYDFPNAANGLGMSSSPLITKGVLLAQVENDAYSFSMGINMNNGETLWKKNRPRAANWSSPTLFGIGDNQAIILQSKEGVSVVNPKSGKEIYSFSEGASTIPSSTPAGNILLVPSNGMTALEIYTDKEKAKQLWSDNKLGPGTGSPAVSKDRFLVINKANVLTCARIETGEILWRMRIKGPASGSPIATESHLYFFNEEGLGQVIEISDEKGEVVASVDLGETILCTPAISGNGLYVRSDNSLWKFTN
ncbi:PQQ-binding-like beta-propeller repeat protein [Opitutales bacterium]|nr:PQQ-binding-like beta-propeller repeat protein [Opitutales bacterium]